MFGRRKSLEMSGAVSINPVTVPKAVSVKPAGKFHIFKSGLDDQWYFHLNSRNGKVMFASEGYMQKNMAIKSINRIKQIAPGATVVVDDLA